MKQFVYKGEVRQYRNENYIKVTSDLWEKIILIQDEDRPPPLVYMLELGKHYPKIAFSEYKYLIAFKYLRELFGLSIPHALEALKKHRHQLPPDTENMVSGVDLIYQSYIDANITKSSNNPLEGLV